MKKFVKSVLFFVVVLFLIPFGSLFAEYQTATGVALDLTDIVAPEDDGSSFMFSSFPLSTGIVPKKSSGGSIFTTLYTTSAPTECSVVKGIRGRVVLESTDSVPTDIALYFGAMDRRTKTVIPGEFIRAPEITLAPPNDFAYYAFRSISDSADFEYRFTEGIIYSNVVARLSIDDADDAVLMMTPDLSLIYKIVNVDFDVEPVSCYSKEEKQNSREKVTYGYRRKKKAEPAPIVVKKQCPVFTQYMKYGDRDGAIGTSKQKAGVPLVISEVKKLQEVLGEQGYFTGEANGVFGVQTKAAVKAYQAAKFNNVITPWKISKPTGWAYQATIRQLNTDLGCYQIVTLDNGVVLK